MIENKKIFYENSIVVGVVINNGSETIVNEFLDELCFLAETAGGKVLRRFIQKLEKPNPKTFIGSGKILEIQHFIKNNDISSVIFDDELSPSQQLNLEKILRSKIIDRTGLILDIFAQRAKTSYAKTQVQLAQYDYLMPRLKGLWTHLERQKGGIGMRGPGETEIETDRRIVRDKVSLLKKKLSIIDKQMSVQRGNRGKMVRVALVGYTNVGKSTIMNQISKSKVFAEDKLFATLDTTVRKVVIENLPFLLLFFTTFILILGLSFKNFLKLSYPSMNLFADFSSNPSIFTIISCNFLVLNSLLSSSQPSVGSLNPVDITLHPKLSNALCVLLINAQSRIVAHAMSAHCHIDS